MKYYFYLIMTLCLPFLLAGCNNQSEYIYLLKHPDEVNQRLALCNQNPSQKQSIRCIQAYATQAAVMDFIQVQHGEAQKYPDAQAELSNYQQQVNQAQNNPELREKIQSELAGVNQYYFDVAETYGQRIMQKQIELATAKEKGDTTQTLYLNSVIKAMTALVNINTGGAE